MTTYDVDDIYEIVLAGRAGATMRAYGVSTGEMLKVFAAREDEAVSANAYLDMVMRMLMEPNPDTGAPRPFIEWNLTSSRTGEPVPGTLAGLLSLGFSYCKSICHGWLDAQVAVPAPLESSSPAGRPSLVELPTTVLS